MATVDEPFVGTVDSDDLPLFRFGLRQLFWFVAATSAVFAALALTHGLTALAILLAVIVVVAHVCATALGNRLRARADREHAFESAERLPNGSVATAAERSQRVAALEREPRSPWHGRGTTVMPWLRTIVIAAIACGGIAGAAYLAIIIGYRTSPAGVIVGSLSVAVLFGWIAFLFGSFYGVFRHGFREAASESRKDRR